MDTRQLLKVRVKGANVFVENISFGSFNQDDVDGNESFFMISNQGERQQDCERLAVQSLVKLEDGIAELKMEVFAGRMIRNCLNAC